MNDIQFRAFLSLLMCSDPWPTGNTEDEEILNLYADDEAQKRGFDNWTIAYHSIPE